MRPSADPKAHLTAKPKDWLIRFAFGGLISIGTALAAKTWGPAVGGLFLGFPAILPATLTLAKERSGKQQANEDARGGALGALALVAFAAVVAWGMPLLPPVAVLALALGTWVAVGVGLWWTAYG